MAGVTFASEALLRRDYGENRQSGRL